MLNNINNKENNSKPEKGHGDKILFVETCTLHTLHRLRKQLANALKRTNGRCT